MSGSKIVAMYVCKVCGKEFESSVIKRKRFICDSCGYHFRVSALDRIAMVVDTDTFEEWNADLESLNFLEDETYDDTLIRAKEKTGLKEAIIVGKAKVLGAEVALGVCDSNFIMAR